MHRRNMELGLRQVIAVLRNVGLNEPNLWIGDSLLQIQRLSRFVVIDQGYCRAKDAKFRVHVAGSDVVYSYGALSAAVHATRSRITKASVPPG